MTTRLSRRRFGIVAGRALAASVASTAIGGCARRLRGADDDGRIAARPRAGITTTGGGARALGLGGDRDGVIQLPAATSNVPLPLIVLLHGATGNAQGILRRAGAAAADAGVAVLAPDSRDTTWDAIRGDFGVDVRFIDRALARVFDTVAIDPARVAVGGFSDGATYALSLGLINGDLFRRVVAFSPGFIVEGLPHGRPAFFISHGTADPILPIDECSRRLVPRLKRSGYEVTFREFDAGHEVPPDIARDAMRWVAAA